MNTAGIAAWNSVTTAQPPKRPMVHAARVRAAGVSAESSASAATSAIIRQPAVTPCPMNSVAYAQAGDATP
jgi:hypothetical protein